MKTVSNIFECDNCGYWENVETNLTPAQQRAGRKARGWTVVSFLEFLSKKKNKRDLCPPCSSLDMPDVIVEKVSKKK